MYVGHVDHCDCDETHKRALTSHVNLLINYEVATFYVCLEPREHVWWLQNVVLFPLNKGTVTEVYVFFSAFSVIFFFKFFFGGGSTPKPLLVTALHIASKHLVKCRITVHMVVSSSGGNATSIYGHALAHAQ